MTDTLEANPRAVAGDNNPPPFEAHKANLDDLCSEAANWADGQVVENAEQDAAVEQLIEDLRLGVAAADASRIEENKPFDEGKAAVQSKYNALIGDTKTLKGSAVKAMEALKATRKPYLDKLKAEKEAVAEAARKAAEAAATEAAAARAAAPQNDLGALEAAELLTTQAEQAAKDARAAEKDKVTGLRTTWTPVLTDQREAILHYMKTQPGEFVALAERLAKADVFAGKRQIPGFDVVEGSKL